MLMDEVIYVLATITVLDKIECQEPGSIRRDRSAHSQSGFW